MGKAAENEKLKLKAAFYNNVAVGAVIGGVFLPLDNFYRQHETIADFLNQTPWSEIYRYLLPIMLAFCAVGWARGRANDSLQQLQD